MTLADCLRVAFTALRANLLRSILTTLGIVIGVASVIILVAIGTGASSEIDKRIKSLGTNTLIISSGDRRRGGRSSGAETNIPLAEADLAAIRDNVAGVVGISGQLNGTGPVVFGNANWTTSFSGVHADFLSVRDWALDNGRGLTARDIRASSKVVLLGRTVARELFGEDDPVGAMIRVKNVPFRVAGVLASKGQTGHGRDRDDVVLMPISTARGRIIGRSQVQNNQIGRIHVKIANGLNLAEVQEDIENLLRQRRPPLPGGGDSFSVRNLAEFIKARTEVLSTLSYLLAATSIISLVVGGIGIMNIMLVSVTERTREIGLRIAVGARGNDILYQFLVEAVALCIFGGLIGIVLGIGGAGLVALLAEWPVAINFGVIGLALFAAAATGIFFGYFPARRAAQLNPIDALRSE